MTTVTLPRHVTDRVRITSRAVTVAPSRSRPRQLSRVNRDGSVERVTDDGWIRIAGPDLVVLPAET